MHALEDAVAQVGQGEQQYGLLLVEPDHYARLLPDIGEQDWIDAIQRQVKPSHREFNRRAFEIGRSDAHVPGPGV